MELSEHAALDAHAQVFLNLDAGEQVSPWAAARASLIAFLAVSVIPLVTIITTPLTVISPRTSSAPSTYSRSSQPSTDWQVPGCD